MKPLIKLFCISRIPLIIRNNCYTFPININNRVGPPHKLFETMVAGRPVITTKGTYSGKLREEENIGIAADFTKEAFERAIIKLRDEPKKREECRRNALKVALTKYNWGIEEKKLIQGYHGLLAVHNKRQHELID